MQYGVYYLSTEFHSAWQAPRFRFELRLGSVSRISALIMAEIYRGPQGAVSRRLGKKRYPFPVPPWQNPGLDACDPFPL